MLRLNVNLRKFNSIETNFYSSWLVMNRILVRIMRIRRWTQDLLAVYRMDTRRISWDRRLSWPLSGTNGNIGAPPTDACCQITTLSVPCYEYITFVQLVPSSLHVCSVSVFGEIIHLRQSPAPLQAIMETLINLLFSIFFSLGKDDKKDEFLRQTSSPNCFYFINCLLTCSGADSANHLPEGNTGELIIPALTADSWTTNGQFFFYNYFFFLLQTLEVGKKSLNCNFNSKLKKIKKNVRKTLILRAMESFIEEYLRKLKKNI